MQGGGPIVHRISTLNREGQEYAPTVTVTLASEEVNTAGMK